MQDIIATSNHLIYFILYKGHLSSKQPIKYNRISTRFAEFIFSFLRGFSKTNNALRCSTAIEYLNLFEINFKGQMEFPDMFTMHRNRNFVSKNSSSFNNRDLSYPKIEDINALLGNG